MGRELVFSAPAVDYTEGVKLCLGGRAVGRHGSFPAGEGFRRRRRTTRKPEEIYRFDKRRYRTFHDRDRDLLVVGQRFWWG